MENTETDSRYKAMVLFGIVLLTFYVFTVDYVPPADAALEADCRAEVTRQGGELLNRIDQCTEQAFAAAMTATEARAAAQKVSSANQMAILAHTASMVSLGGGTILVIVGLLGWLGIVNLPRKKD